MQKNAKIGIGIVVILAVAIPSVIFGINALTGSTVDSVELTLTSFEITDMDEDRLNATVSFTTSSDVALDVSYHLDDVGLYYNSKNLGPMGIINNTFSTTESTFTKDIYVSLNIFPQSFQPFLTTYFSDEEIEMKITGTVVFDEPSTLPSKDFSKNITMDGLNGLPGAITAEVDMISLILNPGPSGSYQINTTVNITNPTDYDFQINSFKGTLKFDDDDGFTFGSLTLPPADGLTIDEIDVALDSVLLIPDQSCEKNQTLTGTDVNLAARLNDEYNLDDDLKCYMVDCTIEIVIFGKTITITGVTIAEFPVDNPNIP